MISILWNRCVLHSFVWHLFLLSFFSVYIYLFITVSFPHTHTHTITTRFAMFVCLRIRVMCVDICWCGRWDVHSKVISFGFHVFVYFIMIIGINNSHWFFYSSHLISSHFYFIETGFFVMKSIYGLGKKCAHRTSSNHIGDNVSVNETHTHTQTRCHIQKKEVSERVSEWEYDHDYEFVDRYWEFSIQSFVLILNLMSSLNHRFFSILIETELQHFLNNEKCEREKHQAPRNDQRNQRN